MTNQQIVIEALTAIIVNKKTDLDTIQRYFSPNYIQCVDKHTLDFEQFVAHTHALQKALSKAEVDIIAIAENDNIVFTHHHVRATKNDGTSVHVQVMAQFTLKTGKIIACHELTHTLKEKVHLARKTLQKKSLTT